MVIFYTQIISVLRLIRWPNLLIVAATLILTRQCILVPLLRSADMDIQMPPFAFILLIISTVFIAAGGYAINDYFDRKIDRINKPDSMVVGTSMYPRHAMAWHLIFTIAGVILGASVAIQLGVAYLSLIFFVVSGLLWFYSTTYKSELLLGNIIVALLTALVPLIVLVFELPLLANEYGLPFRDVSKPLILWVTGFSVFAFLLNLTREIVKDAQDFEGDLAYGKNTIPVAWGTKVARYIAVIILICTIVLLLMAWTRFVRDTITFIYFVLMIVIPLLFVIYRLITNDSMAGYRIVGIVLKIVMITGLGYAVTANYIINNMIR